MASSNPPIKGAAYTFYVALRPRSGDGEFVANPTIATGDFKVAKGDGAPANLATDPVVDADFTKRVKVSLSASEMDDDIVSVLWSDASGAEWCDDFIDLHTVAANFDSLNDDVAALQSTADDIEADTQDLQTQIGTDGDGLTALPWNSAWDAEVQSEVTDGLNAYDPPTRTEAASDRDAIISQGDSAWATATGFSTHDAADVWAVATRVLTANTNLNDPTAAAIADAVLDEALGDHTSAGTLGKAVADIEDDTNELQSDDIPSTLATIASYIDTEIATIIAALATAQNDLDIITGSDGVTLATSQANYAPSTHSAGDVWTVTTRVLTAGTNLNDISEAEVNAQVDAALADYDGPTRAEATSDKNEVLSAVGDVPTNAELATALSGLNDPTANAIADALLDRANGVETSLTVRQAMRIMMAALAGKASGLDTPSVTYRDTNDTKDRITATTDVNGNRTAVTLDAS